MPTCDRTKSIVSFPASIRAGVRVTQEMYDSVEEPLTVEFKWGTRSTPPKFESGNKNLLDEVGHGGLSVSSVYFNNIIYNLYSAGLYAPSHNSWLLSNKTANKNADIILIYNNPNPLIKAKYDYIFLVVPIIETAMNSGDAPAYLNGIASPETIPPQGFSLSSCMPSISSQFAYYATCLSSTRGDIIKNGLVFLSIEGIRVEGSLMASIKAVPGLGGRFANIGEAPVNDDISISSFFTQAGSILSSTDVTRYVLTTRVLFDTARTKNMEWVKGASAVRRDSPSSYKCTQFDPENDLNKDGTVSIDLTSGQILDEVMRERNIIIQSMNTLGDDKTTGNVKFVPYLIGGILGLLFLFSATIVMIKGYAMSQQVSVVPPAGTPATSTSVGGFFSKNWITILVGLVSIILGAVLGVLIALNGVMSSKAATKDSVTAAVAVATANSTR